MKIYYAGNNGGPDQKRLAACGVRRFLISFADFRTKNARERLMTLLESCPGEYILDSGAYSAFSRGLEISPEEYADFLHQYKEYFVGYFNLDAIGDFDGSWDNQEYLESQGLSPIPVLHYGEPMEVLRLMTKLYDFIGIGGMVPIPNALLDKWLERLFFDINGELRYPQTRFHGLGLTSVDLIKKFPFYSVDSTTWLSGVKFARDIDGRSVKIESNEDRFLIIQKYAEYFLKMEREINESSREFRTQPRLI